ncbi:MAG: GvpL/GvpF family gas vesicle protein [Candidatus Rokubacteria bacterium]|nr:GvpL/GvpF family gas vesicle protein [Candidatus Rokubacteria bacterium]
MVRTFAAHYLYALVDGLPDDWVPPAYGGIVLRRVGDLRLVEAPLADGSLRTPRVLGRHGEIVAGLMDADALLPFPAGTIVPAGELRPWLHVRLSILHDVLARLRGHVEVAVRLVPLAPAAPDTLGVLADRLVEGAAMSAWRYRAGLAHRGAELAFLVPRGEEPELLTRLAPIVARASGVAVVPTAARPPYAFVPPLEGPRRPPAFDIRPVVATLAG